MTDKPLRVAHFVQRYPPALGGSEAYFARLGRHLAGAGDSVTVYTTAAIDLEAFWSKQGRRLPAGTDTQNGVVVRRYPISRWPGRRYLLKSLSFIPNRLWQCLTLPCNPIALRMWRDCGKREEAFDLVHATAFPYAWPIACGWRLARRLGVPFLLTPFLHLGNPDDPDDPSRKAYLSPALLWLLRSADCIFVQTEIERAALIEADIEPNKLVLLGMGVDEKECTGGDRDGCRKLWGLAPDDILIGHLANNSEEKGTVDLLRAAQVAWERGARFRVVLAGPEMPNFQQFWRHYPAKQQVRRLGILDERQKRDFYAAIDVFALPSRSDSFGLVLLEAWANGLPNVAYRAGGVAEVIQHESDGLLVSCGDIAGLAQALTRLAEDAQLRKKLGTSGLERTGREFRWEDKLRKVRDVYLSVLSRDKGVPSTEYTVPSTGY
jgi:glycosyltransferase involved in cell wall biosynthesis